MALAPECYASPLKQKDEAGDRSHRLSGKDKKEVRIGVCCGPGDLARCGRRLLQCTVRANPTDCGTSFATLLPALKERAMNKPPPIPDTDPNRNPVIDDDLEDDGIQKDGYDLPIAGDKTDSQKPQKTGAQDVMSALGSG
jgi:hypothetical protein